MSCIIVISSTEHWWVGLYSPLGHTGAPVLKNPAVLKIASAHKKSAAAVALRYDCTLALCLCVRLSASLSLWRFLPLSVALSIPPSLLPLSIHPSTHPPIHLSLPLSLLQVYSAERPQFRDCEWGERLRQGGSRPVQLVSHCTRNADAHQPMIAATCSLHGDEDAVSGCAVVAVGVMTVG